MTVAKYIDPDGNIIPFGLGQQGGTGPKGDKGDKGDPGGLTVGSVITIGTNLNDVTYPGIYYVIDAAWTTKALNFPIDAYAGEIIVSRTSGSGTFRVQKATRYIAAPIAGYTSTTMEWTRVFFNGTWSNWFKTHSQGDIGGGDYVGIGMPNGVVSASPGTYYTDTAGTNGAWRWLKKSGTGTAGWETVIADTGWRDTFKWDAAGNLIVGDVLPAGWLPQPDKHGAISFRRVNDRVMVALRGLLTTGPAQAVPIPSWFSPAGVPYGSIVMSSDGPATQFSRHLVGNGQIYCAFPSNHKVVNAGGDYAAVGEWYTKSVWPTSLPGVAA